MRLTTFREGEMRLTSILLCIFSSMLGIVNINVSIINIDSSSSSSTYQKSQSLFAGGQNEANK